jgi:ferric-dicitrate binding protein FerR (iron transport regulator)
MSSNSNEDKQRILAIMEKVKLGQATEAEIQEFDQWYDSFEGDELYTQGMTSSEKLQAKRKHLHNINQQIYHEAVPNPKPVFKLWPRIAAAASIILMLGAGGYFYYQRHAIKQEQNQIAKNDIAPGQNKATLTLSNGRKIVLSSAVKGALAEEGGVSITKTKDGQIIYKVEDNTDEAGKLNTLTTARGETYQVELPDGSKVWLNAYSSIKYPASFARLAERKIELTGEAYFEVVHNTKQPFRVATNGQVVEDIGTHFNINSYTDENATRTTLVEGSISISANPALSAMGRTERLRAQRGQKNNGNFELDAEGREVKGDPSTRSGLHPSLPGRERETRDVILKPGQQSVLSAKDFSIRDVDTDEAIAWKNGYFQFSQEPLQSIMRKVSRWYNVDIAFDSESLKQMTFSGTISRLDKVSKVLHRLELTKEVQFKIVQNTIMVMPLGPKPAN